MNIPTSAARPELSVYDPATGGYKESGTGREHGRAMIDACTETKSVCVAY